MASRTDRRTPHPGLLPVSPSSLSGVHRSGATPSSQPERRTGDLCVDRRRATPRWSASGPAVPRGSGLIRVPRIGTHFSCSDSAVRIDCVWPSKGYCRVKARYGAAGRSFCGSARRSGSALQYESASGTSPWSRPSPRSKSPPTPRNRRSDRHHGDAGRRAHQVPPQCPRRPNRQRRTIREANGGESDGNRQARPCRPARPEAPVRFGMPEVVMKTFRELLDSGWGERHLDPMTGGCPGCGTGELVIVEDAEHELKLFCRGCNRCWSVDGNRLHHVDPCGARDVRNKRPASIDSGTTCRNGERGTRSRAWRVG